MPTPKDSKNKKYGKSVIEDFNPIIKEYTKKRGRPKGSKNNAGLVIKGPSKAESLHETYSTIKKPKKEDALSDPKMTHIDRVNSLISKDGICLVRSFNSVYLIDFNLLKISEI